MKVVFIRHEKAEDRSYDLNDRERRLVSSGNKRMKKRVPELAEKIKKRDNIVVWTSPALRATETSDILCDKMKLDEPEVYEFIYSGSNYDLVEYLEALKEDDGEIDWLFIVGHQPLLGEWIYYLSREHVEVKKGSMTALELDLTDKICGEILWQID